MPTDALIGALPALQCGALWSHMLSSCFVPTPIDFDGDGDGRGDAADDASADDAFSVDVEGQWPHTLRLRVANPPVCVCIRIDQQRCALDGGARVEFEGAQSALACSPAFATRALRRAQFNVPLMLRFVLAQR